MLSNCVDSMLIGAVVTSRTASSGAKSRSTSLVRSATCSIPCAAVGKGDQRTLLLIRVLRSAQPNALHISRNATITSSTSSKTPPKSTKRAGGGGVVRLVREELYSAVRKKVRDGVTPVGGELRGVALGDEVDEYVGGPVGGALRVVAPGNGALGGGAP